MHESIFRRAQKQDINQIMRIIEDGRQFLKSKGSMQWQNGYPNKQAIEKDILNGNSYLLQLNGKKIGTAALLQGEDETYKYIQDGKWITQGTNYLTIHRMSIEGQWRGKGLGSNFITNAERICKQRGILSIKIDTFPENRQMQKFILKNGFIYCGIIYVASGNKCFAYQKVILQKKEQKE